MFRSRVVSFDKQRMRLNSKKSVGLLKIFSNKVRPFKGAIGKFFLKLFVEKAYFKCRLFLKITRQNDKTRFFIINVVSLCVR